LTISCKDVRLQYNTTVTVNIGATIFIIGATAGCFFLSRNIPL